MNKNTFKPQLIMNRFKLTMSYLRRETIVKGAPLEFAIELTNRCNADCIMCARSQMRRPLGDMDRDLFKKIIGEIREYSELAWLHLAGESLLHPGLFKMIAYAKANGVKLGLSTNAISLDETKALEIIDSGLDLLTISFDGSSKETYEKIRRLSHFERTLSNILNYLGRKAGNPRAPHTQIQLVCMDENQKEVSDFIRMWRHTSADCIRFKPYFRFPSEKPGPDELKQMRNKKIKPCSFLWRHLSIFWDGTVVPCCYDFVGKAPLGNVKNKPLGEIWNDFPIKALRSQHIQARYREIGLCRDCNVPQVGLPFLMGAMLIDDLTIKKMLPFFDNLSSKNSLKAARYYK